MKFTIIRLILASVWIVCAYIWGDWKNWKRYYPTMLFVGMGDLIYIAVFHDKVLWDFQEDLLVPSLNELFVIFTIFFSMTLIYLSNFPKKLFHQIIYIIFWISIYIGIELFTTSIQMQKNHNGWNIWWSLLHNSIMFPLIILHYKKPITTWILTFIFLFVIMHIFKVPFIVAK